MQIDIRRLRSRLMVAIFLVSIGTLTVRAQGSPLSISAPTSAPGTGSVGLPGSPITILVFSDFRVIPGGFPILAPDVASTDEMLTLSDALLLYAIADRSRMATAWYLWRARPSGGPAPRTSCNCTRS